MLLNVKNVSYSYDTDEKSYALLEEVNLNFESGKLYAIIGPSGSGKSTLLSILAGLQSPDSGEIFFKGQRIENIGYREYKSKYVGMIFQTYNLISHFNSYDNISIAVTITKNDLLGEKKTIIFNLLDYLGITPDIAKREVRTLSGGEQQRVAIARTLATDKEIIFADEPTGNLDDDRSKEIINIFKDLAKNHNKCIVVVTHSIEIANQADVIFKLSNGRIERVDN